MKISAISAASLDMSESEISALKASIAELGQLVPIVMYRGEILDGRKRLRVCEALGREPITLTIPDDASAPEHAIALNLMRTHYTVGQRAVYAARWANVKQHSNRFARKIDDSVDPRIRRPITATEAGAMFDVDQRRVSDAQKIKRDGVLSVTEAIARGDLSLDAGLRIVKTTPKEQQSAKVAHLTAAPKTINGRRKGERPKLISPRKKPKEVVDRAIDALLIHVGLIAKYLPEVKEAPPEWSARIENAISGLKQSLRRLKEAA